ncbi:DNA-binding transcriptional LysR family regulator [Methylorubrum rhodinum]|uniref:DNA-binding transcriptional LysR family regulator n=1 Tax=Methylorubrum rhodinum TaxID=29428 RepID=A0A840ZMB8_9HYPH|nr:LysR family transcriptional regulator [Methylorubrum rhodinum]MBB5759312.1 DNA-binding transcriptional LysR family regulator [Methylorubrum rhodinum]
MPVAWDEFRLVRAIAERGALAPAAGQLGINPSTAFRRLAALEAGLGARLFERHRSGYVPTPAGEAMVAAACRMEEEAARFDREVADRASVPSGSLRITAPAGLAVDLLMPMLARFRGLYPRVRLDLVVSEEALNLSRRDADVALRATREPPDNLVGRRLSGVAWAVYGPVEASLAADPLWVSPDESVAGGLFTRFVAARTAPERVALRINTVQGLYEAVAAGIGIGALPCYVADRRPSLRRLSGPEPELAAELWLLTHPDLRRSVRVRAFLEHMAGEIAPLRASLEGRGTERLFERGEGAAGRATA